MEDNKELTSHLESKFTGTERENIISFCSSIAENIDTMDYGDFHSECGKYTIKYQPDVETKSIRVGHISQRVEFNDIIKKLSIPSRLFYLFWAFNKVIVSGNGNIHDDIDTDALAYSLWSTKKYSKDIKKELFIDFIEMLYTNTESVYVQERVSIFKEMLLNY